jgi:hypothetical protein
MKPPTEVLRIEARRPATGFPATTLRAHLKQVNIPALNERMRQAVEEWFPQFLSDPSEWTESLGGQGAHDVSLWITAGGHYDLTQGRFRRYAGGRDLPYARYYSVCQDAGSTDGGTLCYELMSYWNSTSGWYLFLTDSTVHRDAIEQSPRMASFLADRGPTLVVIATKIETIRIAPDGEARPTGETHPIFVPLRLVQATCDNVLDLRLPAAQDWLATACSIKGSRSGFGELFANLISPSPGGNAFHQNIGAWLRAHECLGLVFPSARRDVSVDASDERIIAHDGWNFVSYEGAQSPALSAGLGPPFPWLTPSKIGVKLFTAPEGIVRSWRVTGAEAGEWGRINYEIRRSRGQAPPPSVTFSPFDDGRNPFCAERAAFAPLEPDP